MDNFVQTTTPNKPTGISPPEVPLGIQGTFRNEVGPERLDGNLLQVRPDKLALLETFDITTAQDIGTKIFDFYSYTGLPIATYTNILTQGVQVLVPWNAIPAYYSRLSKVDFELYFQPIKVADCRVAIELAANYRGLGLTYNSKTMVNNAVYYHFDNPTDYLHYKVPMFWPVINVNTNTSLTRTGSPPTDVIQKNAFIPTTRITGFISAPYVRNSLQPTTLTVVVWIKIVPRQTQGESAMRIRQNTEKTQTFLPLPYWYTRPLSL